MAVRWLHSNISHAMNDYERILHRIQQSERYQRNLDWGKPRKGHPEGTVRAHIRELEQNLDALSSRLSDAEIWKLRILIHVHDTFKADAHPGVPIRDGRSHASLARRFLEEFCDDESLLAIIQYHDEPYALWHQAKARGHCDKDRLENLLLEITDWNLYLAFLIIDG